MKPKLLTLLFSIALSFGFFAVGPALAADAVAVTAAAPSATWWANGELWTGIIAAVSGIFGIWKHSQLGTAQKVIQSIVKGVEAAETIPGVGEKINHVKASIAARAEAAGVGPQLDVLVQSITAPKPTP
jgi:hypothetical protein